MDKSTVFTKTAKGITQVNQKSGSIPKDLMKVLKLIDGKSNFGQLMEKADLDKMQMEKALNLLAKDGFARIFQVRKEEADPFAEDDDFDFTAPNKMPASTQRVVAGAANDISELVRQQEKADADRKQKEQAHEQARAKAKVEAEARAKLEAEARARQQAEQQAMEQARRAKEASERARIELEAKMREEEARKRAMAEQQARVAAEQKAREESEQRRMAELRANAEKEANERARAELEAKLRVEESKRRAEVEQQARAAAAQQAKEDEEQRKLAEIRVKAEREAKALAEARARAEAEAAAMARARAEAEAAAKRKSEEANAAEAQMKARLKEEIEARIRGEMEELLRAQAQEKVAQQRSEEEEKRDREEMRRQIMEEARLAAKAELEERLREEREAIAVAETEARARAEKDAQRRAEEESKKRAEAEARAAAEAEARLKAEDEARRLRAQAEEQAMRTKELEARARAEAEARARDASEGAKQLEAERQAKYEAEARARIELEEREKRERELSATIDAERRAKEEAEMRAKIEARARETVEQDTRAKVQAEIEGDMTKRAELEGKAQAKAYMEAKARAEHEEDEAIRAEQARKAREIAEVLRTRVESDEAPPEAPGKAKKRPKRRGSIVKPALIGLAVLLIAGVGALHVIPMRPYAQKIERTLSAFLHDDVNISSMTFRLVPVPHFKVDGVSVGKLLDAKANTGRVFIELGSLFSGHPSISEVELDGVSINAEAAKRIPLWSQAQGRTEAGFVETIRLRGVKMEMKPVPDSFDATLRFKRDGTLAVATLAAGTASATLKPNDAGGFDIDASARNWSLPIGAPIPVSDVRMKGTWTGQEIVVPEFEADAMEGKVNGTLRVNWSQGVRLQSDLSLARVNAQQLIGAFTKAISVTGKLDGNFSVNAEAADLNQLFANPRAQGKFKLAEGSVSNVDLVAVMQSDTAGQRAGVTKFAELTGEIAAGDGRSSYRNVALQGGVLRGNGGIDVGNGGNLAGRLALEIRSQVAQDRGAFTVSGTVQRPAIRRGG